MSRDDEEKDKYPKLHVETLPNGEHVIHGKPPEDKERIAELEQICNELYQVLGSLAEYAGYADHPAVQRALNDATRGLGIQQLPWPDLEIGSAKIRVASIIAQRIKERGFTYNGAAVELSIRQSDVSNLLNGRLEGFSLRRLHGLLQVLGKARGVGSTLDVEESVRGNGD